MYENMPNDGKEIKERLGMAKSAEQSDNNLNQISDFELENLVKETINDIRQKPQHTKFQKPAEAQFSDLFLKKVPPLHSSSNKTKKDLRDSLLELYKKEPSTASDGLENTDAGFLDIKLKPVIVSGEDLNGKTT